MENGDFEALDYQIVHSSQKSIEIRKTVGTNQTILTIDELLTYPQFLTDGLMVEDTTYSVTWQIYLDGATWKKRIYDGMIHVKAAYHGDILWPEGQDTIDGVTISYGDIVLQVGGLPQLRGLWTYSDAAPIQGSGGGFGDGYIRHPLFKTVEDQLANVIVVVDGGNTWKNSQWVYTTMGTITGCAEDENGDPADPELLHWYYWAARPSDPLTLGNPEYTHLVGDGISDSWLNFDCLSSQAINSTKHITPLLVTILLQDANFNNFVGAETESVNVYMPYDSSLSYITTPINKEYFVQKIGDSDYYVAFYEDVASVLPDAILITKNDWCKTILYQNPLDVEDVEFFTHSNRRCYRVTQEAITVDGDTAIDIPTGYSTFAIQGTTDDAVADVFDVGITVNGNELVDGGSFSRAGEVINTYQELTVDLTAARSIYLTWRGDVQTIVLSAPGTGYTPLDVITLVQTGSSNDATAVVNTVGASGEITGITLDEVGSLYFVADDLTVTGGTGNDDATINVTAIRSSATEIDLTFVFYQDNF